MDSDLTLDFIIIVVLIIANGLFSMTELAIVNAKKRKLEELAEAGNERAKIICFLLFKLVLPSLVF